jgi:recombination protein RecT
MTDTTETSPSTDVAKNDGPSGMVQHYENDFAQVLPSHINSKTWVRLAVGALRRDKNLNQAAKNDPGALMVALLDAARKGLEPGTEQYYLVPRKEKGIVKVKGIEGYQGIIERIYRAGAASSVIVEVVRENDTFRYVPGRDERPVHEIDWFGQDRGQLVGVYAYAVMVGGATSKVVVLNKAKVMEAKAKSDGANSQYSPWNQGDGEAMWLKTAARRLEKWVPTSSEYMKERLRVAQEVIAEGTPVRTVGDAEPQPITTDDGHLVDPETGVVEAELVDDEDQEQDTSWPEPAPVPA